jgi:hypothetical protein
MECSHKPQTTETHVCQKRSEVTLGNISNGYRALPLGKKKTKTKTDLWYQKEQSIERLSKG